MSRETSEHLNQWTLIGNTDQRGTAWHYRLSSQGKENNHYPAAVPVADVERRLFYWKAQVAPLRYDIPASGLEDATHLGADGAYMKTVTDETRNVTYHGETGVAFGVFKTSTVHQYREWLLNGLAQLVTPDGLAVTTDSLGISSAGLLRGGAQAWVQIERPDTVRTREGVDFRTSLLACSSHDGSLATSFSAVHTMVVCDNTMAWALDEARESGLRWKIKRSTKSMARLNDARDALGLIVESEDTFAKDVARLCETKVSPRQFDSFLTFWNPIPEGQGAPRTRAEKRRDALLTLWNNDNRVTQWKGTAFGVLQAVNTYNHHIAAVRGTDMTRAERNMSRAMTGEAGERDTKTLNLLTRILETA
ncbi:MULTISPECIES: DUF932 domain-containing protein [Nocardia]|uniref:DUF932 domain-containing protein n=1 Tax=Nocardia TaxID=1817 RepID=UPI000D68D9CB|nr:MULTISPECIES: DUF932 domain-containing protein [Nocardia]